MVFAKMARPETMRSENGEAFFEIIILISCYIEMAKILRLMQINQNCNLLIIKCLIMLKGGF